MPNTEICGSVCFANWAMGRHWENFEEDDRKALNCLEETVTRNMDVNNSPSRDSERVKSMVGDIFIILKNTYIVTN